jgi:hypothetical protein
MKQKIRSKRKLLTPKTILRLPDLEVAKSAVLNSLSCPDAQRGCRSARPWLSGTECIWNLANLPQAPSTFGSEQSAVSHTKLRIVGCSARIWQPESGGSRALRSSGCGLATG